MKTGWYIDNGKLIECNWPTASKKQVLREALDEELRFRQETVESINSYMNDLELIQARIDQLNKLGLSIK